MDRKTDCDKILREKCIEVTPLAVSQMDYYLVGHDALADGSCQEAILAYNQCVEDQKKKRKNMIEYDSEYMKIVNRVMKKGTWKLNERTGKKCLFYHGDMMKFDLSSGHFPLLTTKKMLYKAMIGELIGFLRGVNNAKDFRDLRCNFWNANANESKHWLGNPNRKGEDDLGRIYGVQARDRQSFFKMEIKKFKKPIYQKLKYTKKDMCNVDYTNNSSGLVGHNLHSTNGGDFKVIKETRTDTSNLVFDVQFLNSGHVLKNVQKSQLLKKKQISIKDPYHPSICGIAAIGNPTNKEYAKLLEKPWREMITRCYSDKTRLNSKWYRDKDIFVEDRWLLFENFVEDFTYIDRWELKLEFPKEYSLDKDFYCSNMYSLKTCIWASKREQNINTLQAKKFKAISPDNEIYYECGVANFCEKHDLNRRSVEMALANETMIKGWRFENLQDDDNYTYRIRIDDQLAHCIAKIKHNPSDRRMIVDHWNPNELHLMALPPCHMNYSFGVRDGYLDMNMYQRSCDVPLGIPMNIASYSLLLILIAKITGLKPGVFTHFMWNIHIYEDQYEQIKTQIGRKPFEAPTIKINRDITSLDDIENKLEIDDIEFINYEHHDAIKFAFSE